MNRLAPQHTYTHTYILTFLSLILQALPPRHFGAYDSRDRLHSVFSVNDWARGPIRRRDGERKSEDNGEEGRGSLRGGGGEQTQHRFKHEAERVPWPLSGPKSGLEFLRIALLTVSIPWQIPSLSFFFATLLPIARSPLDADQIFAIAVSAKFCRFFIMYWTYFETCTRMKKKNIALLCILFSHELIFIMLIILCTTIFSYLFFFYYFFIFVYLYMLTLLISVFTLLINIVRHKN